jgi:hypothetical protein
MVIAQLLGSGCEAWVADIAGIPSPDFFISASRKARRSGGTGFERANRKGTSSN